MRLYRNGSNEDHVAFVLGDVSERENVLTRVHSECFHRRDSGLVALRLLGAASPGAARIAQEGSGVLIYLRQEGRGIGLLDKLRAYNLQDLGHDTVEANLLLGHDSDERSYDLAAHILCDLNVRSIRLLTNNPAKIQGLRGLGVTVKARGGAGCTVPCRKRPLPEDKGRANGPYHRPGARKGNERHANNHHASLQQDPVTEIAARVAGFFERAQRPFVTLCYAQSLDACLSSTPGKPLALSGPETLTLAHSLRASHDAVMVGIGTVLSDNPRLTVRHVAGRNPQPVVLDSRLRIPLDFHLLREPGRSAWVAAVPGYAPERRQAVEAAGAAVLTCARASDGRVCLTDLLSRLASQGIRSVMVEGGVQVIRSLMASRLVDFLVITIAPRFIGGEHGVRVQTDLLEGPGVRNFHHSKMGDDLVLWGEPAWRA